MSGANSVASGLSQADENVRPEPDAELVRIADYICDFPIRSELAFQTARICLADSLGCAMLALKYPACTRHLGPIIAGTQVPLGARVPGTNLELDPIRAAWNFGAMVRWLDYNDTWLAAEWGHPSDNLGAILPLADSLARLAAKAGRPVLTMRDVLEAMIKAHEIQGVLALENSFNRRGLDHVILVKIASVAVATRLIGGSHAQVVNALSQALVDGQSLRTYRHAPNTGSRKSWAAGDAASRALHLAMLTMDGEDGYPGALSAPGWGFQDVLFGGEKLRIPQNFSSYVMENVLFKVSYPAEFHAQTAVEAAAQLHLQVAERLDDIERIVIHTHEAAIRIISKTGALNSPADRDHCLQYMTAVALIYGDLTADHYEHEAAADVRIDRLRAKMEVREDKSYSRDYLDPEKRSIPNRLEIHMRDGSSLPVVAVEYPLGHMRRRDEGIPLLRQKFRANMRTRFGEELCQELEDICFDGERLDAMPVPEFVQKMLTDAPFAP